MGSEQGRNGCPQMFAKLLRGPNIGLAAHTGKRDCVLVAYRLDRTGASVCVCSCVCVCVCVCVFICVCVCEQGCHLVGSNKASLVNHMGQIHSRAAQCMLVWMC